jgi:methylase of polypeptide subunit release factors
MTNITGLPYAGRNPFALLRPRNVNFILKASLVLLAALFAVSMLALEPQQAATESEKKAGQSQIQLSHTSAMDRYPDEYSAVQNYFQTQPAKHSTKKKRLLSFGSATGEEAMTLASMYFKNDAFTVFGVDLHQESIDKANASIATHEPKFKDGKIMLFNGNDSDISVNGPYDAIFANSVLCYHGTTGVNARSIVGKYPFADFEESSHQILHLR